MKYSIDDSSEPAYNDFLTAMEQKPKKVSYHGYDYINERDFTVTLHTDIIKENEYEQQLDQAQQG